MDNTESCRKALQLNIEETLQLIGSGGIFEKNMRHFEPRIQQSKMVQNVVEAYNDNAIALIEAGTGTGKSIAYILPAILWALKNNERTVISTHTIALQEQLINKDIPLIAKILNAPIKASLIKGMGNYLCLRKLEDAKQEMLLFEPFEVEELITIDAWSRKTSEGSKMTLPMVPSATTWDRISAESDTCSNIQCKHYKECFFFKARQVAEESQILVANHHLLFADLVVRSETENYDTSAVLPYYCRVVIDEAHHIEDVATEFFGGKVSRLGILRVMGRIAAEKHTRNLGRLPIVREKLQTCFASEMNSEVRNMISRLNIDLPGLRNDVQQRITELFDALADFVHDVQSLSKGNKDEIVHGESKLRLLKEHSQHVTWQAKIVSQAQKAIGALQRYIQALFSLEKDLKGLDNPKFHEQTKSVRSDISAFSERLTEACSLMDKFLLTELPKGKVRWVELQQLHTMMNVSLIEADLDVSKSMVNLFFSKFDSIILCSATLTTNKAFDFVCRRLGIVKGLLPNKKITTNIYDSPFNYPKQALFAIPTDLPLPHEPNFTEAAIEQVWQAALVSRGAAFVLFTSYGMMQKFYEILLPRFEAIGYTIFKQGEKNRQELISGFISCPRAILFGTDSFWEGIDISGEALRCVIIVKLPFKVPTEPIVQARTEIIEAAGGDPFFDFTLPSAIVKFKQGFGRLIRGKKDRGCVICLDTRLITKGYGKFFISTLPKCQHYFASSKDLQEQMRAFYRKTHYLVFN